MNVAHRLSTKIYGPFVIVSLFFCSALVFLGYSMINGIYDARYTTPRASAEIGYDILLFYYEKSSRGEMSVETAKETALEVLKTVRYEGEKEYFWINDTTLPIPSMVMHPIKPALDGQVMDSATYNVALRKNQNLFQAVAEVCLRDGGGYVDYLWPKPGTEIPVPKISYVKLLKEWDWIVGTGVYIDDIAANVKKIVYPIALAVSVLLICICVFMYVLVSRLIVRPINHTVAMLKEISEGEGALTKRLDVKSADEIGNLAIYFNLTLDKVRDLVLGIRKQSGILSGIGLDLTSKMMDTSASIDTINTNIQSVKNQNLNQSASVIETNSTMEQIALNIQRLNAHIDNQATSVTQSSTAIEEMLANIASVSQTLVQNAENMAELTSASGEGRTDLAAVTSSIREVAKESEGLVEISEVIQNIASQTNLLSMNAAIEAAHAGDSGKGFAVVADEIRKLAESSGAQAKTVSLSLKKIQDAMERITRDTDAVLTRFEGIDSKIKIISDREKGMLNAMNEQSIASNEILGTIGQLNDITFQVKSGSNEMLGGSHEVIQEGKNLGKVTQEVTVSMATMTESAQRITLVIQKVNEISLENKKSIDALMLEVGKFKVEE